MLWMLNKKFLKKFLSTKKWPQSGRDYNFRGDYKFRAHCMCDVYSPIGKFDIYNYESE
jgi:hypothetical protein